MFIILTRESDCVPDTLSDEMRYGSKCIAEAKVFSDTKVNVVDTDDFVSEAVAVPDLLKYIDILGIDQFREIEVDEYGAYYMDVNSFDCFYDIFGWETVLDLNIDISFNLANNTLLIKNQSYTFNLVEQAIDKSKLNGKLAKDILMGTYSSDKRYFSIDSSEFSVMIEYYKDDIYGCLKTILGSIYFVNNHFLCINMIIEEEEYGNDIASVSFLYDLSLGKFVNINSTCEEFNFILK